jgi:hypothetical protein
MQLNRYKRELSAGAALIALLIIVALISPSFFSLGLALEHVA